MLAGRDDEPGEPAQELHRLEEAMGITVAAALAQGEGREAVPSGAMRPSGIWVSWS